MPVRGEEPAQAEEPPASRSARLEERAGAIAHLSLGLAELTADPARLEQEVVRRVGELVGDATALWRKDDEGHIQLVAFSHRDPRVRAEMLALSLAVTHSDEVGVLPHAYALSQPVVLGAAALQEWLPLMQPAYREYARRYGMASLMIVPLRVAGRTVALLGVSRDRPPEHDQSDQRLVEQVAAVVAVALENERLQTQLRTQLAERERAQLAAHRAALHDPLTGLANRRLLLHHLTGLAARDDQAVGLLVLDLDDFKHVNDSFGHDRGDAVLCEVAGRLQQVMAEHVTCGRTTLARLGGDEFAVVVPHDHRCADPAALAERLVAALATPLTCLPDHITVTGSVGVAQGLARDASSLLRHADIAMYRAKRQGLGWTVWEAGLDAGAEVVLHDLAELRHALARSELRVHYQPLQACSASARRPGAPHLVEALVRWQHPRRGLLAPGLFLPLVARAGLTPSLTSVVLHTALHDVRAWQDAGHRVQVAVNVDAGVLASPDFVPTVLRLLDRHGLPPHALCLELTESELLAPSGPGLLARLRREGLAVALDDFGTGYSSLAYLADLQLDRLKLDQAFVRRLCAEERAGRLVQHVVALVHDLGCAVVAEGVETAQEDVALRALGVDWQQGYLHGRPAPAQTLTERLAASS